MLRSLALCLLLIAALVPESRSRAQQAQHTECPAASTDVVTAVDCLADSLSLGIVTLRPGQGALPRVAVYPFEADRIPIQPDEADAISDRLVAALLQKADGRFRVIARNDLQAIMRDLEETNAFSEENPVPAVMESAQVDVLIVGRMARDGDDLRLRYQAIRTEGRAEVIAATSWQVVRGAARRSISGRLVAQVADAAARHFRTQIPDLRTLYLAGLAYEDTGFRTPVGDALQEVIAGAVAAQFRSVISERRVAVLPYDARLRQAERGAGHVLSGSYWEYGAAIEVRLRIEDSDGRRYSFREVVRRDDLPAGRLRPPGRFGPIAQNQEGPVRLRLNSDRGRTPRYTIGERFTFLLRMEENAYVYCFYLQADDTLVKIFPNSRHPEPRLAGGMVHVMPGEVFPFTLDVLPPAGIELLKCYATLRDVTPDLPAVLQSNEFRPLPASYRFELSNHFRQMRDAGTTEASLPITVVEAR